MFTIPMINKIYYEILDFVFLVKKLEYTIREKYSYEGESIFRGSRVENLIPMKGEIIFESIKYEYKFHGTGIDFISKNSLLRYTSGQLGLGVFFTPLIIKGYKENVIAVDNEFNKLVEQNLIKQWMPEMPLSKVFYLV
jgi:hypothetical protein